MSDFCRQLDRGYARTQIDIEAGLVLAVSGGADSMAALAGTLDLFSQIRNRIVVAHVDHSLRESESAADAEFVRKTAENYGIACHIKTLAPGSLAVRPKGSLEENARTVRYKFLSEVAAESGAAAIVTAHHQRDQAETILHNVIRGTGLRGLAGISQERTLKSGIRIIRPLLGISPECIRGYLQDRGIQFRHDASNADTRFTRNRIRHDLLPMLRDKFNVQTEKNVVSLGEQANELLSALDFVATDYLDAARLEQQPDSCRLQTSNLSFVPEVLICHILILLWDQQRWSRQKMTARHWKSMACSIRAQTDTAMDLPHGLRFSLKSGRMHVCRSPEAPFSRGETDFPGLNQQASG